MKKKIIALGIILIALTVVLSGCTNNSLDSDSKKCVGTWKDSRFPDQPFIFLSNGTGSWAGSSMSWKINDSNLVITIPQSDGSVLEYIYSYTFSDNDQSLNLVYSKLGVNLDLVKQ